MWSIGWAPNNASKWQMGYNLAFKGLRDSDVLVWVRGQRKMSQALGAFGLLEFTMLLPILACREFWNLWTVYFFNFPFFSGRGKPLKTETADT
jgi:hypothetical protein